MTDNDNTVSSLKLQPDVDAYAAITKYFDSYFGTSNRK